MSVIRSKRQALDALGIIPIDASQELIARVAKELQRKYHPDRPGGVREKFLLVTAAKDFLIVKVCPECAGTGVVKDKIGRMTKTKKCGTCK